MRLETAKRWAASAAVVLVAVAVNRNLLQNGFVYDDASQILNNPYIRGPQSLAKIFGTNVWSFLGPEGVSNYYRPLMHLVYMADYHLFGLEPAGYHSTSVAFHVACSLLVLYLGWALSGASILPPSTAKSALDMLASGASKHTDARRHAADPAKAAGTPSPNEPTAAPQGGLFPGSSWYALVAALLFAAHPIHTEAVAWAAAITELTCAFFFLWSVYLYVRGHAGWSAIVSLPALLAKETAVMLLPTLMVYEHWYRRPGRGGGYFLHLVPLAIYLDFRYRALGGMLMVTNRHVLPWGPRVLSTVYLAGKYLVKLVSPAPFNLYHVFHPVTSLLDWRFQGAAVLLVAVAAAAFGLRRRDSGLWFAVVWMILPLVPVLYLSRVGDNVFTERYLYLPAVGFCWLLAATALAPAGRWFRPALAVLLLVNYGLLTYYRNAEWRDDITLYTATLAVSPESDVIRGNLGSALLARGQPAQALPLFTEVALRQPENAGIENNLGAVYAQMGVPAQARQAFERAAALRPRWPLPWFNLGRLLEEMGDRREAERAYRQAVALNPDYAEAHGNLGILLVEEGREREAEQEFRTAGAYTNLGKLFLRRGVKQEAEAAFRRAVEQNPNDAEGWYLLGKLQQESGRVEEAAHSFSEARRASGQPGSGWKEPPADPTPDPGYNKTRRRR